MFAYFLGLICFLFIQLAFVSADEVYTQPFSPSREDLRLEPVINIRLNKIRESCGELCNNERVVIGQPSVSAVNCQALFEDDDIDISRESER